MVFIIQKKIVERTGGKVQLSLEDDFIIFKLFIY
ncbi:MAG: hypothetical protein ACI8WT_003045 [Clostridium sp.]|jgi:hypothetical protein